MSTELDKKRNILIALGWKCEPIIKGLEDDPTMSDWFPSNSNKSGRMPDLSDPGVLFPLFRDFVLQNRLQYRLEFEWQQGNNRAPSWKCTVYAMFSKEWKFNTGQVYGLSSTNETEAVINAWHAALVAMGKIHNVGV